MDGLEIQYLSKESNIHLNVYISLLIRNTVSFITYSTVYTVYFIHGWLLLHICFAVGNFAMFPSQTKKRNKLKKKNTPWIYFTLTRWSITPHSADRWVKFKINTCRLPLISSATLFTPTHKHKGKRKRHSPTPLHTSRRRRGCDLSLSGRNTCVWWETLYDSLSQGTPGCPPLE